MNMLWLGTRKVADDHLWSHLENRGHLATKILENRDSSPTSPSYTVDMEGDGGSTRQPAETQVDVGLSPGHNHEVSHSKWTSHLHKIHQHIPLSHLSRQDGVYIIALHHHYIM